MEVRAVQVSPLALPGPHQQVIKVLLDVQVLQEKVNKNS